MPVYPASELLKMCDAFRRQSSSTGERWLLTLAERGHMLYPYPIPDILYRGQHTRYARCLPSILRGIPAGRNQMPMLPEELQASLIMKSAKSLWFQYSIEKHPAIIWALQNNVHIDSTAISQHYELDTGYIDLSHDFEVAAFFATCIKSNDEWIPATAGKGILYRFDRRKIPDHLRELTLPVGLQPLPRPEQQGAWVTEVPMGFDFETHPAVTWLEFEHDEAVSEYFLQKFNGGAALFPPDPLARVAAVIKAAPKVPSPCIELAIKGYAQEPGGLPQLAAIHSLLSALVDDAEPTSMLTEAEVEGARQWWEPLAETFGYGTKVIPVRVGRIRTISSEP